MQGDVHGHDVHGHDVHWRDVDGVHGHDVHGHDAGGEVPDTGRRSRRRRLALVGAAVVGGLVAAALVIVPGEPDVPEEVAEPPTSLSPVEPLQLTSGDCAIDEPGCVRWRLTGPGGGEVLYGPAIFAEYGFIAVTDDERSVVHGFHLRNGLSTWSVQTDGEVRIAPAAGEGIVVAVVRLPGVDVVHAYEALTGEERWRSELSFGVEGPIEVRAGIVFVRGPEEAVGLAAGTGRQVRTFPADDGVSPGALGRGGFVFYGHGGGIRAVDAEQDQPGWEVAEGRSFVAPVAPRYGVGRIIVAAHPDGSLAAYRGRDGELLWRGQDLTLPTLPPLAEPLVVVGVRGGRFIMLEPWSGDPLLATEESETAEDHLSEPSPLGQVTGWILSGRTAYVMNEHGIASFDVRTGGPPLWRYDYDAERDASASPPVVSIDDVLVTTADGLVALTR